MKVLLMHRDRDFGVVDEVPAHASALTADLQLSKLFESRDEFLAETFRRALFASLHDLDAILYRQAVLKDSLESPEIVRELYAIAIEALEKERKVWRVIGSYPEGVLHRAIEVLEIFVLLLRRLREVADNRAHRFRSEGFQRFFEMLRAELSDDYIETIGDHLRRLRFRRGVLISAQLGKGLTGINQILRKPAATAETWFERIQRWAGERFSHHPERYVYQVADRDEAGHKALSELRGRGIASVAIALAISTDHILSFFAALRLELAFFIYCIDLRNLLAARGEPTSFPEPVPASETALSAQGLYDVCLSLTLGTKAVGNDIEADNRALVMVTGANRGGKSTFLRSVGLAQLMMQCGMFVPATAFRANLCDGVFTHFKREEDAGMKSGKLDEELARMSAIVDRLTPTSLVLLNESFASTNEREGSEIARQIVYALLDRKIKVIYVTHMFDLANGAWRANMPTALFLRAERLADGQRTFRLREGEPLPTSYGQDIFRKVFVHGGIVEEAVPT